MSSDFDFSETSGRDFFDFYELFFITRDIDVGDSKTFGRVDAVLDVVVVSGGVEGAAMELVLGHILVVSDVTIAQEMPERKKGGKRYIVFSTLFPFHLCEL